MKQIKYIGILLAAMLPGFFSCISEDLSDCPDGNCSGNNCPDENEIRLYYTDNPDTYAGAVKINPSDIDQIDLFIFDSENVFLEHISDTPENFSFDYYHSLSLEPGMYNFVSWVNLRDYYYMKPDEFIPGQTHMDEFLLHLDLTMSDSVYSTIEPLFFGNKLNVEVKGKGQEYFYEYIYQNTYKINVTIKGLKNLEDAYQIVITDTNGSYAFNNSYAAATELHYVNDCTRMPDDLIYTSLTLLRISHDREPQLKIYNLTENRIIFQNNLIEMLLQLEGISVDIDIVNTYEYDIFIEFLDDDDIRITINGWKLWEDEQELHM